MIGIQGLFKNFGVQEILRDVSFSVEPGDIFGIVGHSGAGKSTLLRCVNGLETCDRGSVRVMGREVASITEREMRALRREMGMVFQSFNLMERKNVAENIAWPLEVWNTPREEVVRRVGDLLDLVGLAEKQTEKIRNLSGGQKQRVGIARALALNPKILLCDEATSALDPKTTLSILELLRDINRRFNVTVLLVTHQMEVVKMACNRVLVLDQGCVTGYGRTEDLFLAPPASLKELIRDEYAVIPSGINVRLMFPREIAKESIITGMARDLEIDFSVIGGRLERYRDDVLGFLIISVRPGDLDRVQRYLEEKRLIWEVMDDVA